MTAMRPISSACFALALFLVGVLAWATFDVLAESYGSGPPYYGRTTNMDKWASPVPGLLAIDLSGLGIAGGLIYLGLRLRRQPTGASRS
jgi:hypothetical protein